MNKWVTDMVPRRRKLRESDQVFEVGKYNVVFYFDEYKDGDSEYYLLHIYEFDGDTHIGSRRLYVFKENEDTYGEMWKSLHNETRVDELYANTKDNQRI